MDINTDHGYIRAMNLDMGPGSSPGPDITMALGGNEATHVSPSCTLSPPQVCRCPQDTSHSVSLYLALFAHGNSARLPMFSPWSPEQTTAGLSVGLLVPLNHHGAGQDHASMEIILITHSPYRLT